MAKPAQRGDALAAVGFLAPTFLGFVVFILGPILAAIALSFYHWDLLASPSFVGLANYQTLIGDSRLRQVYLVTGGMAIAIVAINLTLGLLLAVLLEARMPRVIRSIFRLSYFFPFLVSASAVALMWRFLLHRDLGLLNYVLGFLDVERINWLGASAWTPWSVVLVAVWKSIGFNVLVYLAGLQAVPRDLHEAAAIDGAGSFATFRKVTLPLLTPTVFFLFVINTINAFQLFAEPFVLTGGGPGDASRTVVLYVFEQAFRFFNMGYASAVALSLFVVLSGLTVLQFALSKRWTFYR